MVVPDWDSVKGAQAPLVVEVVRPQNMGKNRSRASTPAPRGDKEKGKGKLLGTLGYV